MLSILSLFYATHYITSTFREQQYFPFYVHEFAKVFFFFNLSESQFKFTSVDSRVDFFKELGKKLLFSWIPLTEPTWCVNTVVYFIKEIEQDLLGEEKPPKIKCLWKIKESACNTGDLGSIPGSGRSPGEENGYPLQYHCSENSMDTGAWWATGHEVSKTWKQLSD